MPIDPAMRLSPHFTLVEFTASATAAQYGIDNTPSEEIVRKLIELAQLAERVRTLLGDHPMTITSGYRCPELNAAVGSAPTSQHVKGEAMDFICPGAGSPHSVVEKIDASDLVYGQLIEEGMASGAWWVHLSLGTKTERLKIDANGTRLIHA